MSGAMKSSTSTELSVRFHITFPSRRKTTAGFPLATSLIEVSSEVYISYSGMARSTHSSTSSGVPATTAAISVSWSRLQSYSEFNFQVMAGVTSANSGMSRSSMSPPEGNASSVRSSAPDLSQRRTVRSSSLPSTALLSSLTGIMSRRSTNFHPSSSEGRVSVSLNSFITPSRSYMKMKLSSSSSLLSGIKGCPVL